MAETTRCSWCGRAVEPNDGFRLLETPGERRAAFCRLEHVVPWGIRGPSWEPGAHAEPPGALARDRCSLCEAPLAETRVVLVRHRGEHRIPDAFCSVDHLVDWAKRGGRWA